MQQAAAQASDEHIEHCFERWAEAVERNPGIDVPGGLESACFDYAAADLSREPFTHRCVINETEPIDHPPEEQQPLSEDKMPKGIGDVLKRGAIRDITSKLREIAAWHSSIKAVGKDAAVRRPHPLALGKDAFVGDMWKRVWDLRGSTPKLAATQAPAGNCKLNVEYMEKLFEACADRELVGLARFGILTKADLDPQIVICPSLFSLYEVEGGVDAVVDELAVLEGRGWYTWSNFIPFAPWRAAPGEQRQGDMGGRLGA